MAISPDEAIPSPDADQIAEMLRLGDAIDAMLRDRTTQTVDLAGGLHTKDLVVRHALARDYRAKGWHVYGVEDTEKPMRLVAP